MYCHVVNKVVIRVTGKTSADAAHIWIPASTKLTNWAESESLHKATKQYNVKNYFAASTKKLIDNRAMI